MPDVAPLPPARKKARLVLVILILTGFGFILTRSLVDQERMRNLNSLRLGEKAAFTGILPIPIHPPVELDFLSKDAVYCLRRNAVLAHPQLLRGDYEPSSSVFGRIQGGVPWWGIAGEFYYGNGDSSILGASEESRYILNPYLLVAAEFYGLSIWDGLEWDEKLISNPELSEEAWPLYCPPRNLKWEPRLAYGEVTYDVSGIVRQVNALTSKPIRLSRTQFTAISYNARDLNLNHLYLSPERSRNISGLILKKHQSVDIRHFIHMGGSCGYPGGCNNMSPFQEELEDFKIEALPAEAHFLLWRNPPESVASKPDMVFVLRFE